MLYYKSKCHIKTLKLPSCRTRLSVLKEQRGCITHVSEAHASSRPAVSFLCELTFQTASVHLDGAHYYVGGGGADCLATLAFVLTVKTAILEIICNDFH